MSSGKNANNAMERKLELVSRYSSILCGCIALLVLAGWFLHIQALKSVIPGAVSMKSNTALCFAGCVVALLLIKNFQNSIVFLWLSRALSLFVFILALLTLGEHFLGWTLAIDELIIKDDPTRVVSPFPGRMSANTSIGFLFTSASLLLLSFECYNISKALATFPLLVGWLSLMGYGFGIPTLYGISKYSQVAIHTGINFVMIGVGILLHEPRLGFISLLSEISTGGTILRRLLLTNIVIVSATGWICFQGQKAGWYGQEFDMVLFTLLTILLICPVTWWICHLLHQNQLAKDTIQERLNLALQSSGVGTWSYNIKDGSVVWDDYLHPLFGLKPGTFQGSYEFFLTLVHPKDRPLVSETVKATLERDAPFDVEYDVLWPDGSKHTLAARGKVFRDQQGDPIRMTGVCWDITQKKEMELELIKSRDAAMQATKAKSEFLANMSHEIRTPMNGVIGLIEILKNTPLTEEQRGMLENVDKSGEALLQIINDILDFSKIDAGMLRLEKTPFRLKSVIEDSTDITANPAHSKDLEVLAYAENNVPNDLFGDPNRLRQVLTNLLTNAIKFTTRGEVVARISNLHETGDEVQLLFEVMDTGIGISQEQIPSLFQPFSQADSSTTRRYGGTGLGLVICKRIVEGMGGEIGVRSALHQGSTFWFKVSFKKAPPTPKLASERSMKGLRVLVVDDNPTNRQIIHHQVLSWNMRNGMAENAAQALQILKGAADQNDPYDIAILDMHMPDVDGLSLAKKIRSDPKNSSLSLVMMTSGMLDPSARDLLDAVLAKPVKSSHLHACLTRISSAKKHESKFKPQTPPSTPLAEKTPSLRKILIVEDNELNQKVLEIQLLKFGCTADLAVNGMQAVEKVSQNDYDLVLMDCQLPELDGYETTKRIRQLPGKAQSSIIIAMTAHALQGDREKCLAAGMNDYLSKPIKLGAIQEMFNKWFPSSPDRKVQSHPDGKGVG